MELLILVLFLYCIYLHCSKLHYSDCPKHNQHQVDMLIKAHYKPKAEEYIKLKGLSDAEFVDDGICFGFDSLRRSANKVYYNDLDQKIAELKQDLDRNCCKPKTKKK